MTYSIYARMSLDSGTFQGDWYVVKTKIPLDKTEEAVAHYKKTWRYVELREEKLQ